MKQSNKDIAVYYNNINGYQSKRESFLKIIQCDEPDIIALCETKRPELNTIKKDEIPGYAVLERNVKQGKEGLLFAVKKGTYKTIREITESELKSIMTVKIEYQDINIRVVIGHAPQETAKYEERSDFFNELAEQVERALTSGDKLIVVGDMNARIEKSGGTLQGISPNGKLLKEVIDEYELEAANFHEKLKPN